MASVVNGLKPEIIWKHFETLTKIPRPSKHEEKILAYLRKFANERNLEIREDDTGNIVVLRPGSGGGENAPTIIIQSHVDMVCEKNRDSKHDFMNDSLDPKEQILDRSSDRGLFVNDDDQDWGSAGMNDVQEDSE